MVGWGRLLEVGTGFHPELSGRENIFLSGAILGMRRTEIARQFDEIVAFAEIEKFLDTPVKRYSSGMYVRLAFAVAAHLEPEILLVDEVLAVGDAQFQKKCLGKMGDVAHEGRTVLFVSHNMGAIAELCGTALCFKDGEIADSGSGREVVRRHLSSYFDAEYFEISSLRPSGYGEEVRFQDIRLAGTNGSDIAYRQPLSFCLTLQADRFVSELTLGGSIYDETGTCIGNIITDHLIELDCGQRIEVTMIFRRLVLAPGNYYMVFSIGTGTLGTHRQRHDYDIVIGKPSFRILPVGSSQAIHSWDPSWGRLIIEDIDIHVDLIQTSQTAGVG